MGQDNKREGFVSYSENPKCTPSHKKGVGRVEGVGEGVWTVVVYRSRLPG